MVRGITSQENKVTVRQAAGEIGGIIFGRN